MSEYIDIEAELGDGGELLFHTNLKLTAAGAKEVYASIEEMEVGSPVAQALSTVDGLASLTMDSGEIIIGTQPESDWHAIIADVTAALKDFFL